MPAVVKVSKNKRSDVSKSVQNHEASLHGDPNGNATIRSDQYEEFWRKIEEEVRSQKMTECSGVDLVKKFSNAHSEGSACSVDLALPWQPPDGSVLAANVKESHSLSQGHTIHAVRRTSEHPKIVG